MVLNSNLYNGNVSSIHKNIKKIEVRKTNSIGFFAKSQLTRALFERSELCRSVGGSAFCKKSVNGIRFSYLYLFYVFMNTRYISVIQIRIFKWKGVYVRRYWFSIFVVVDRYLLYSKTLQQIGVYKFH